MKLGYFVFVFSYPQAVSFCGLFLSCFYLVFRIIIRFSVDIKPYLFAIQGNFTSYPQAQTLKFKGSYSHRIYEFIRQWLNFGNKDFSLIELKDRLKLDDSYDRIDNLKARVLDPAILEINEYSDMWVKYSQRKTGRKVTHIGFTFGLKEVKKKMPKLTKEYVENNAKIGESWEEARERLSKLKESLKN